MIFIVISKPITYLETRSLIEIFPFSEMKCLDKNDELTPLGKILARLPIEPRLGKMMILGCMFRVGDALSTMAANSSTFPEVYNMGPEMRRLTPQQRAFAGARYSDHVAMLHVFQYWEEARANGEYAENVFCESRNVSQPTLRVTWEAKVSRFLFLFLIK